MFPFGIQAEGSDPNRDERGPDTMNRLLLHGARYHDRTAVFVAGEEEMPDWKADRLTIRVALALREDPGIEEGDVVALWMALSPTFGVVERAIWGLGASSAVIPLDASAEDVERILSATGARALIADRPIASAGVPVIALAAGNGGRALPDLLEKGGALDTPERASAFRAMARRVPSTACCAIESGCGRALTQGEWVSLVREKLARFPPRRGERKRLAASEPDLEARIDLYAGWADGLTTLVLERVEKMGRTHG